MNSQPIKPIKPIAKLVLYPGEKAGETEYLIVAGRTRLAQNVVENDLARAEEAKRRLMEAVEAVDPENFHLFSEIDPAVPRHIREAALEAIATAEKATKDSR
ncbi:MAG: hypothetical protein HKM24_02285 [Gammaproteobacteria bacterium]|nr:hypothetical protein [Gammaproteobacteria bacterium]